MTENRDRPEWLVPIFSYLEASSKQPQTGLALLFLSVFGTGTLPHRYFRAILAWRRGLLSALWHGDPAHRYLRGILAWQTVRRPVHDRQLTDALTGLRHGDPAHRYLSGIPTWRRGLLSALWHDNPAHRRLRGIPVWRSVLLIGLRYGVNTLSSGSA